MAFFFITASDLWSVEKARGLFIAFGVGPRLPLNEFAATSNLGWGLNVEIAYTDNEYLPLFLFAKFGFDQFPGSQDFYQSTDYSTFSTNCIPVNLGARYYFPPLLENVVLFLPLIEASFSYTYYQKLHEFKAESGKNNYTENLSRIGFSIGAGISMFMMEILASYNYLHTNQFIALDLKVRLPLYIVF
ncbi:MAG TPA: hypothetical protein VMT35_12255 [Ignavibacteriaceae bacterium]|nr:hypothetical protein [Ignavibacteriaceae bacterium]